MLCCSHGNPVLQYYWQHTGSVVTGFTSKSAMSWLSIIGRIQVRHSISSNVFPLCQSTRKHGGWIDFELGVTQKAKDMKEQVSPWAGSSSWARTRLTEMCRCWARHMRSVRGMKLWSWWRQTERYYESGVVEWVISQCKQRMSYLDNIWGVQSV